MILSDEWIRRGLYPGIKFNSILGADGTGQVVSPSSLGIQVDPSVEENPRYKELLNKRVVIQPGVGWDKNPRKPEQFFSIMGLLPNAGTFAEYVAVSVNDIFLAPEHLNDAEAAALPLAHLTAYRAVVTKGEVARGDRVLITGIGGGVALAALRICLAIGAECYVTSSSPEKIKRAVEMGAKAGVNYRDDKYLNVLKETISGQIDAVIDGAGGDFGPLCKLLNVGARIVCYGGTETGAMSINMLGVIKNVELRGSTMGSRHEFGEMVQFVAKHRLPVDVDTVIDGLDHATEAFDSLLSSSHFGKLVIRI
ncbi:hypothetical protein BDF19DRAFT_436057 [Syncephalis fuscata]|nr:hypothetical protein BDF19DRAFT_436057 [Syncephalis fuscata]